MKKCPECNGKIPEPAEICPICGSPQDPYAAGPFEGGNIPAPSFEDSSFEEEASVSGFADHSFREDVDSGREEPVDDEDEKGVSHSLKRLLLEIFLFIFAFLVLGVIILATDFNGSRTELRRMCMMDSGNGSESDSQHFRIKVKHYILVVLDLFDGGGTGESVPISRDSFNQKQKIDDHTDGKSVEDKSQVPKIENLPPSPPEVEAFSVGPVPGKDSSISVKEGVDSEKVRSPEQKTRDIPSSEKSVFMEKNSVL